MTEDGKVKIEKGSVQETLVIPLYARMVCSRLYPDLLPDDGSEELMNRMDYDFSALESKSGGVMMSFGALEVAMRRIGLMYEASDYLSSHPGAAVVNMGCGLDDARASCDDGACITYNIDMPDVMETRNRLIPPEDGEVRISADLNDHRWMDLVDGSRGAVFLASGLFYYFRREQVRSLVTEMAERFPGGRLVFDAAGKAAVKRIGGWVGESGIDGVDVPFHVKDAVREISGWSRRLSVSSRGFMHGYGGMDRRGIRPIHRLMARVADGAFRMRIVRIDFSEDNLTTD